MTPQERQLVDELFDRLEQMEGQPRDREAERAIREGLARAPHAIYPLVQTVLVQDEALRLAEGRIRELGGEIEEPQQERGFLDSVREALLGPDSGPPRSSVPQVPAGGSKWSVRGQPVQPTQAVQQTQDYGHPGGSFLGTAAAAAAGVIGGSLLLNMLSGGKAYAGTQDFGDVGRDSPWGGGARDSELAREAGLNDIGRAREDQHGWFDTVQNVPDDGMADDFGFGGDGGGDGGGGD